MFRSLQNALPKQIVFLFFLAIFLMITSSAGIKTKGAESLEKDNTSNTSIRSISDTFSSLDERSANSLVSIPYYSQYQDQPQENYDCGPADVAMILQAYNKRTGGLSDKDWIIEVRNRTGKSSGNTSFANLETALSSYGVGSSEISPSLSPQPDAQMDAMKNALNANKPVIALVHGATLGRGEAYGDHFVIVRGFSDDGQSVHVNDPDARCSNSAGNWYACGGQQTWSFSLFKQAAFSAQYGPYGIIVGDGLGGGPPPQTNCNNVSSYNGVRLYKQDACNGGSYDFSGTSNGTNLPDPDWNDKVASVYVGSGWSVMAYEHYDSGGSNVCLRENKWDLDADYYSDGKRIANTLSSVKIYHNSDCTETVNPPAAPSLNNPGNGTTINEGQSINLQWSSTGSEYYGEIWGGPSGTLTFGWQGETSKDIGSQWPGYTYSWHVKAKNSGGESSWSNTWTFTVQGDDNYEQNDTIETAWYPGYKWDNRWLSSINGYGKQSDDDWYRIDVVSGSTSVKVDCNFTNSQGDIDISLVNSAGSVIVSSTGISDNEHIEYASPAGGTYYIKVFFRNAGNTYDLWWDDIQPVTPAAPTLINPTSGTVINEGQSINLQWSATGSEYYGEIWGGPGGTLTFGWQGETSKDIGSQWPGYTYSWHVKARNGANTSGWSSTNTFTVRSVDTTMPTGQMTSPAKDSTQRGPNIKLTANATDSQSGVANVKFYAWSADTWSNQQWIYLGNDTTAPYEYDWNVSGLGAQTYAFVTIDILDNAGNQSGLIWDPNWTSFSIDNTVTNLPAAPTLVSPSNNSTYRDTVSMGFSWGNVSGATAYYAHLTGGPSIDINSGWITATSWSIGQMWPGTYQWQVKAKNANGEGSWSSMWSVTIERTCQNYSFEGVTVFTEDSCRNPNMLSYGVQTGIINMSDHPTFNDSISSVYVKPGWSVKVYSDDNASGSSRCLTGTMWDLGVDQYDNGIYMNDSISSMQVYDSNSCAGALISPSLKNPTDGSSFMDTANMYLDWNSVLGATEYYAQLTGTGVDRNSGWVAGLEWHVGTLTAGTYQWHAKARNSTTESGWSQTRSFTINQTIDCNSHLPYSGVKLFADKVCNGQSQLFNAPTQIVNLSSYAFDNVTSSIYVGPNWSVKVYKDANGLGSNRCLVGSMWDLSIDQYTGGGYIDNTISSIQVFNNNSCTIPLANNAQFVSQVVPSTMVIGKTYSVKVTMKNNGSIPWKQTQQYRLGSQNPQDNSTWGTGRVNLSSGQVIKPGAQKTFTFNVVAPMTTGTYNFQWRMLKEGVEWFGGTSTNLQISVVNNPPTVVKTPTPVNLATNQKSQMTLSWVGATDPDGHAVRYDVYVGTSSTALSRVSSDQTTKSYKFIGTGLTTYYWRVVSKDIYGAATNGPIWSFTTKSDVIPAGTTWYQETDWRIYYTGTWKSVSNTSANGGTYKETSVLGNYVEFKVGGNSFSFKRLMGTSRGKMLVCIDGTASINCQEISNYASSTKWQQTYTYKYIPGSGVHTIRIINNESKKLDIDAIRVFNSV